MRLGRLLREQWFFLLVSAMVLAPQVVTEDPGPAGNHLGLPRVHEGDPPHYLVMLNSLLLDGDFDLRNNYLSVHIGSSQAGKRFAGSGLDHHLTYYVNGQRLTWGEVFQDVSAWPRNADGVPQPQLLPGMDPRIALLPEYPAHPVGVTLLLAPLLFPLRHSDYLEPAAVFLAGIATVLAMFVFTKLLRRLSDDAFAIRLTVLAVFLGSPVWYYSRTFFNEPFILLAIVSAYAFVLSSPARPLLAGCLLAAAATMKPQMLLLGLPLALPFLIRRELWPVTRLAAAPVVALVFTLAMNQMMYGSPLRFYMPFYVGDFFLGMGRVWLSPRHGLVPFAPAVALAFFGWPRLFRERRAEAVAMMLGFLLLFAVTSLWRYWEGGWCYASRLLVPIIPLWGAGLVKLFDRPAAREWMKAAFIAVVLVSCVINAVAVLRYWQSVAKTPIEIFASLMGG